MPHYVVLYKFTDTGIQAARETVARAKENRRANESRGFKIDGLFWTQGAYDLVAIVEAPNEKAMMVGLFNVGAAGNVRSETMRAFTEDEMEGILQEVAWPEGLT